MRSYDQNEGTSVLYQKLLKARKINIVLSTLLLGLSFLSFWLWISLSASLTVELSDIKRRLVDCESGQQVISQMSGANNDQLTHSVNNVVDFVNDTVDAVNDAIDRLQNQQDIMRNDLDALIYSSIQSSTMESDEKPVITVDDENATSYTYGDFLVTKGNVSKEYAIALANYYNKVPRNVREAFEADGWKIVIINGSIIASDVDNRTAQIGAVTIFADKAIYCTTRQSQNIIHEMGHYLDYKNGFASLQMPSEAYSEWQSMLELDGYTHVNNYSTTPEYFAESFSVYVLQHDDFVNKCPNTAFFIEQALSSL